VKPTLVIDASVAVKWVVDEIGSTEAVALRRSCSFAAPDLLTAECANILWKKVRLGEVEGGAARLAARLLMRSGIHLVPTGAYLEHALELAVDLGHPAYDCLYLVLLVRNAEWRLVTADERLLRAVRTRAAAELSERCFSLYEAPAWQG